MLKELWLLHFDGTIIQSGKQYNKIFISFHINRNLELLLQFLIKFMDIINICTQQRVDQIATSLAATKSSNSTEEDYHN
jgi:hypothetical protein